MQRPDRMKPGRLAPGRTTPRLAAPLLALTLLTLGLIGGVFGAGRAAAADVDTYSWPSALCDLTGSATGSCSDWGWGYSNCPSNDTGCMRLTGSYQGTTYGESDPWGYALRNCTSYVAQKISQEFGGRNVAGWGNAANWATAAQQAGYALDPGPKQGDVAVWGTEAGGGYGHVAYVASVSNGVATFDEYNAKGDGSFTDTYTSATHAHGDGDWFIHLGTPADSGGSGTTPGDGTRIAQPSGSQYIFERGAALPVDYPDAVRYNAEGDSAVQTNDTAALPSAVLPANTILRPVGSNNQYLWNSAGQLQPIGDTPTSQCLFIAYPQNGLAVVPADWMAALPVASPVQCSLADGTRFTQADTGSQQYISVRGATFPLTYGDAVAYDGEGDKYTGLVMQPGYIQNPIHTAMMPAETVLRAAGGSAQYLWDGEQLHYIPDTVTSQCLVSHYPQNGIAIAPGSWTSAQSIGANAACS